MLAILRKFTLPLIFLQNTLQFLKYEWITEEWYYLAPSGSKSNG